MNQIIFRVLDAALWSAMIAAGLGTSPTLLLLSVEVLHVPRLSPESAAPVFGSATVIGPALALLSVLLTLVGFLIMLRFLPCDSHAEPLHSRERFEAVLKRMCWFGATATILGIMISALTAAFLMFHPHGTSIIQLEDFFIIPIVCFALVAALGWFLRRKARLVLNSLAATSPQDTL